MQVPDSRQTPVISIRLPSFPFAAALFCQKDTVSAAVAAKIR
jgi:hypothetical protein